MLPVDVIRTGGLTAEDRIFACAVEQILSSVPGTGPEFRLDVSVLEPGTLPKTELKARRWLDLRPKD